MKNQIQRIWQEIAEINEENPHTFNEDDFFTLHVDENEQYFQGWLTRDKLSKYNPFWVEDVNRFERQYDNFKIILHIK